MCKLKKTVHREIFLILFGDTEPLRNGLSLNYFETYAGVVAFSSYLKLVTALLRPNSLFLKRV